LLVPIVYIAMAPDYGPEPDDAPRARTELPPSYQDAPAR
jgi:hypothetical protein